MSSPFPDTHAGFWLGHPGSLMPFHGIVSPYDVVEEDDVVLRRSMGGGVRARVSRNRAARAWSVGIPSMRPEDFRHLRGLHAGTFPSYQFIDPLAQVTNVLTPERSLMRSLVTGTLALAGGWPIADVGGSWTTITGLNPAAAGGALGTVRIGPCPIPPVWTGRAVTVSAQLATARSGGAVAVLDWLDAAGAQVGGGVYGNYVTGMDGLRRSMVTATPPWGAVACRIGLLYAEVIAEPQVTWTDSPTPWDVGNGADRVLISKMSRSVRKAHSRFDGRLVDVAFDLVETGPAL